MTRRAICVPAAQTTPQGDGPLAKEELAAFETFDMLYRALCAILYNFAPGSGHPGGSISSGRFVAVADVEGLDYDLSTPTRSTTTFLSTRRATRRWACTARTRCETSGCASLARIFCPPRSVACASRTCSASGATRRSRLRSSRS